MVKVLILCSNPVDTSRLQVDRESREIQSAIHRSPNRDCFDIQVHLAVRASDLRSILLRNRPEIVHFASHGATDGLVLEDDSGRSFPVSTEALTHLFSLFGHRTRCVVLSAAFSEGTARAISQHTDFVIGMRRAISDEGAITFSTAFYEAVAYGENIRFAYRTGCSQLQLSSHDEEADVPVLISNTEVSVPFVQKPAAEEDIESPVRPKPDTDERVIDRKNYRLGLRRTLGVFVGINEYDDPFIPNLSVCVDDVSSIHGAMGKDLEATLLSSGEGSSIPSRNNIFNDLLISSRAAEERDLLLFYYSGHGFAENNHSYLVAKDSLLSALKYTALAMGDVIEIVQSSEARAKVIILDACHSGAAIGKSTFSEEFIEHIFEEAEGMAILSSCKQGEKSWEWQAKNCSVFTYYLQRAIQGAADYESKGFVTISDAYNFLTHSLKIWSKKNGFSQTPTMKSEVVGDIILTRVNPKLQEEATFQ